MSGGEGSTHVGGIVFSNRARHSPLFLIRAGHPRWTCCCAPCVLCRRACPSRPSTHSRSSPFHSARLYTFWVFCSSHLVGLMQSKRTRSRTGRFANITGQGLGYLYQAPCARSLVCLGLRNQHAIGHLDLRSLGSQVSADYNAQPSLDCSRVSLATRDIHTSSNLHRPAPSPVLPSLHLSPVSLSWVC